MEFLEGCTATILDAALFAWIPMVERQIFAAALKFSARCLVAKGATWFQRRFARGNNFSLRIVLDRTIFPSTASNTRMVGSNTRFPIERRRARPSETSLAAPLHYNRSHTRRESDLARMRTQHWMELADAALGPGKPPRRHRRGF